MDFGLTGEQKNLTEEVRRFVRQGFTKEAVAEAQAGQGPGPHMSALLHKIGAKGWLLPYLPKEYGGLGLSYVDSFIIFEELEYGGVWAVGMPLSLTRRAPAAVVAPLLLRHGSEEQKKAFLPGIARGETHFAVSYTEPNAGSDAGSLKTTALRDGDWYVVNGEKTFNTHAHYAHYHWLAVKTEPHAPHHRGISILIVDSKTPGISLRPFWVLGGKSGTGWRVSQVFFDNVRVPARNLVGKENEGFYYMATAIDVERVAFTGGLRRLLEELVEFHEAERAPGLTTAERSAVKRRLVEIRIKLEVGRVLGYRIAYLLDQGTIANQEASALKVFLSEVAQELAEVGLHLLGLYGLLASESKWAPLKGEMEALCRDSRVNTVAGGTSEVQRNVIAIRGLGLPR